MMATGVNPTKVYEQFTKSAFCPGSGLHNCAAACNLPNSPARVPTEAAVRTTERYQTGFKNVVNTIQAEGRYRIFADLERKVR